MIMRIGLLLVLAALPAACAGPEPLTGAAAARSRGASLSAEEEAAAAPPADSSRPADPWLDDARDLARVNGQIITLREVRQSMGRSFDDYLDRRDALAAFVNRKVQDLVVRRVVVEEVKRVGFIVSDEDMEQETAEREKQAARAGDTLAQNLRDMGMTRTEWNHRTKDEILFRRAFFFFTGQAPGKFYDEDRFRPAVDLYVGPVEVRRYAENHGDVLGIVRPAEATVRMIDLRNDTFRGPGVSAEEAARLCDRAMDAVEERLRAGEDFGILAKELSEGPEAKEGGLFGPFRADSPVRQEYRDWAFREGRADGNLSPRFRLPAGLLLLRLEHLEPARSRPIEEFAPEVRARLVDLKTTLAWNDVQIALLEQACVEPATIKTDLLGQLRANNRRVREELQ